MFVKTNTAQAIIDYYHKELGSVYSENEIQVLLEIVFEHFLDYSKIQLKMNSNNHLSESELLDFHFTLKRLRNKEPIQYILEKAPFFGLDFYVDQNVLIPRPETEELVDLILKTIPSDSKLLDIGTGSGCIPIVLKKNNPGFEVNACDIDSKAVEITKRNSSTHNLSINVFELDILDASSFQKISELNVNCIVSNPPYIQVEEQKEMDESVTKYEPDLALFVPNENPFIFYKQIANIAISTLTEDGYLFFEINQKFGNEIASILKDLGFANIEIIRDINNNERIVYAQK